MGINTGFTPITPISAKPSEVRAAAKAERERKENLSRREAEAQMRMQKIKDEISSIKRKESIGDTPKATPTATPKATPKAPKSSVTTKPFDEQYEDSQIGEELAFLAEEIVEEESPKQIGQLVMNEMNASFARLSVTESDINTVAHGKKRSSISAAAMALSSGPPRRRSQLQATKSGQLHRMSSRNGILRPEKRPSNLVPEMRRRAMQRDLLFDDDHVVFAAKNSESLSTHSPVTGLNDCSPEKKNKGNENPKHLNKASSLEGAPSSQAPLASAKDAKEAAKRDAKETKEAAKREEEKKKSEELREKLEEAKDLFQKGHDLCWKVRRVFLIGWIRKRHNFVSSALLLVSRSD
jgi:hypothetical protein